MNLFLENRFSLAFLCELEKLNLTHVRIHSLKSECDIYKKDWVKRIFIFCKFLLNWEINTENNGQVGPTEPVIYIWGTWLWGGTARGFLV